MYNNFDKREDRYEDTLLIKSMYNDRFNAVCKEAKLHNFIDDYVNGMIPESINLMDYAKAILNYQDHHYSIPHWDSISPTNITTRCFMSDLRNNLLVYEMGFCTVTMNWVNKLVNYMIKLSNKKEKDIHVLEICSGHGTLSKALSNAGIVNIEAIDNFNDNDILNLRDGLPFFKVSNKDMFEALNEYEDSYIKYKLDFIICAWPRLGYDLEKFVERLYDIDSNTIFIYIGDGRNGCCANKWFFDSVKPVLDIKECKEIEKLYPDWSPWIEGSNEIIRFYKYSPKGSD